jgi:hypothetical protein
VIPIPDRHALSIGVLTDDDAAHSSCYADPAALPRVEELAIGIEDSLIELEVAMRPAGGVPPALRRSRPRPRRDPPHRRTRQPVGHVVQRRRA